LEYIDIFAAVLSSLNWRCQYLCMWQTRGGRSYICWPRSCSKNCKSGSEIFSHLRIWFKFKPRQLSMQPTFSNLCT